MSNVDERAIQLTDLDAIEAKAYAVKLNYWNDRYIKYFNAEFKSKTPEINRGYFSRTKSIEIIVKEFIKFNENAQIINIGAGCDTLYFRLLDQGVSVYKFLEIDLPDNVFRKISSMSQKKIFHDLLGSDTNLKIGTNISKDPYYLFASDLRSNADELINSWQNNAKIELARPTLFIAECVFVYILPDVVNLFLESITRHFQNAAVLSYDPINMTDAFGKVMIQNLKMRQIELRGVSSYAHKEMISERYTKCGFSDVKIWSISEVYKSFSLKTLKRIEALEMLDDPEMMKQLFDHYCLVLASTRSGLFIKDDIASLLSNVD